MTEAAFLLQTLATCFMLGLIWFVQIVHYPLLAQVGGDAFVAYEAAHTRLTGYVVGPVMVVELVTAGWLLVEPPTAVSIVWPLAGAALLAALWAVTGRVQVPLHRRLREGFDVSVHRALVRSNWVRTALWSLRGGVVMAIWAQLAW